MTGGPIEARHWPTFALVGAGPTRVELAGQIRRSPPPCWAEFRRIHPDEVACGSSTA